MNKKATLTFRNVRFNDPKIQRDGVDCLVQDCVEISYTNSFYVVDVSGFSAYTVVEGQVQPPPGGGGGGGGGGGSSRNIPLPNDEKNETEDNRMVNVIVYDDKGEELERWGNETVSPEEQR